MMDGLTDRQRDEVRQIVAEAIDKAVGPQGLGQHWLNGGFDSSDSSRQTQTESRPATEDGE